MGTRSREQGLQDAMHFGDGEQLGDQLVHHRRGGLVEVIEQGLDVLAADDLVRVLADHFAEVGDEHGGGVHHAVAAHLRFRLLRLGDPQRGQAEGRLGGFDAAEGRGGVAGVHGEELPRDDLALARPRRR